MWQGSVELHSMEMKNGVMKMRMLETPAHSSWQAH